MNADMVNKISNNTMNYNTLSHLSDETTSKPIVVKYNMNEGLPPDRYSIISCSTPVNGNFNYAFILPLTVRAWQRISYQTLILIAGTEDQWKQSATLKVILDELYMLRAYVLFIETPSEHAIMISQTSRLLACSLVKWQDPSATTLVTSDADLWPLVDNMFTVADGKKMLSLNSECCRPLHRHNLKFKMLPMCNIAMTVQQWRDVMNTTATYPYDSKTVLQYFHGEFGDAVYLLTHKGENDGWYMDQIMISLRIEQWLLRNDPQRTKIQYVRRNTGRDRIDRIAWRFQDLNGKVDCHVLEQSYKTGIWERLYPLLKLMHSPALLDSLSSYRQQFVKTFI